MFLMADEKTDLDKTRVLLHCGHFGLYAAAFCFCQFCTRNLEIVLRL